MSIRTVQLDDDDESPAESPYEIYRRLDLGAGGNAVAPAVHAKTAVEQAIRKKYGRCSPVCRFARPGTGLGSGQA